MPSIRPFVSAFSQQPEQMYCDKTAVVLRPLCSNGAMQFSFLASHQSKSILKRMTSQSEARISLASTVAVLVTIPELVRGSLGEQKRCQSKPKAPVLWSGAAGVLD